MCCLLLLAAGIGPRFAFLLVWIFGDRVDNAYDTWVWPLLGLVFAPWTALFYALAWGPAQGVSGSGWILVAFGIVLDLATYAARFARRGFSRTPGPDGGQLS
jgi:hypothetical protein